MNCKVLARDGAGPMREAGAAQAVAPDEAAPPAAKSRSGARSGAGLHRTGLKEAELNRIIHLKKNLDYSDALIQYAGKYRKIGWDLVAVNFRGEPVFDLDFHEAETVWGPRLADWGLEGQQVNLGVRTGAPSRLLVLEVHREESRAPFNQRGDWCSGCVAEVGMEREQHYYTLPKGWQPPASFFLESFQIMVFGEGGLILVPPSLDPRLQTNLRWLRPPWESPPTRPSQALCRFITENAPRFAAPQVKPLPEIMAWNKIYPAIQPHPRLLQALLAPAASPAAYYRTLLGEAQAAGLGDAALLLGLLWHAPLGEAREPWDKLAHLEEVVKQHLSGSEEAPTEMAEGTESEAPGIAQPPGLPRPQTGSPAALSVAPPSSASPGSVGPEGNGASTFGSGGCSPGWQEIFRLSQENLVVERRRYEAMIYELGKLGALQEFLRKENRQNKALRDKLEGQWDAELKYLRQQLTTKKPKKGWYRSWWQE